MTNGNREPVIELVDQLCQCDIISFDVFDTLLLRPFSSPRVLFSIMEQRLGIYKFAKIRVDSEEEVRSQKLKTDGHDNTTLEEIYRLIAKKTNLDAKKTAQLEFELELEFCRANPYFREVVDRCKAAHKTIIVCSDMYLSGRQIQSLLRKAGYPEFDGVYVSSELNRSKKRGDLFAVLRQVYQGESIIHIGDDKTADVSNYDAIRKITEGIQDFVGEYIHVSKVAPFLMNISPYDAYLPFSELANSVEQINSILAKLTIPRGKFYDAEIRSTETFLSFLNNDE